MALGARGPSRPSATLHSGRTDPCHCGADRARRPAEARPAHQIVPAVGRACVGDRRTRAGGGDRAALGLAAGAPRAASIPRRRCAFGGRSRGGRARRWHLTRRRPGSRGTGWSSASVGTGIQLRDDGTRAAHGPRRRARLRRRHASHQSLARRRRRRLRLRLQPRVARAYGLGRGADRGRAAPRPPFALSMVFFRVARAQRGGRRAGAGRGHGPVGPLLRRAPFTVTREGA